MAPADSKSIPTRYKNILFRSKLEADWARCFDRIGVVWEYEPEGRYCGDEFVLTDFWLPKAKRWFEVKGQMTYADHRKFKALLKSLPPQFEEGPDDFMIFGWPHGELSLAFPYEYGVEFISNDLLLVACGECNTRYFIQNTQGWGCPHCRRSGDNFVLIRATTNIPPTTWFGWPNNPHTDLAW